MPDRTYVAMATKDPAKGLALWIRQGDITKVVSYAGKYTSTPEFHIETSLADLNTIVNQYMSQTPLMSHVLGLWDTSGDVSITEEGGL